jgi:hypothetical protein
LDSGSSIHVWNDRSRFLTYKEVFNDYLTAGEGTVPILGYGDIDLTISGPKGARILRLRGVAHCERFSTNLVSLKMLRKRGIEWNTECLYLYNRGTGSKLCNIYEIYDQFVIEKPELKGTTYITKPSSYHTNKTITADDWTWHHRMGHLGPEALKHLVQEANGIKITGISTNICSHCVGGGMKRPISRSPPDHEPTEPGEYLAIDTHTLEQAARMLGSFKTCLLTTCRFTGRIFDYYMTTMDETELLAVLNDLFKQVERDGFKVKVIRADNEIFLYPKVRQLLNRKGVKMEPSPPNTQALNGLAESSGGEVKRRARCMALSSHLPEDIWPEIYKAAVYLINRSPKQLRNWQTAMGLWRLYMCNTQGIQQHYKPLVSHLKVYGCLAYAMTSDAQLKRQRLKRLRSRVNIGWLVGYNSTNIYRIWIPKLGKLATMRDVLFDEGVTFKRDLDPFPESDKTAVEDFIQQAIDDTSVIPNIEAEHQESVEEEDDVLSCIIVAPRPGTTQGLSQDLSEPMSTTQSGISEPESTTPSLDQDGDLSEQDFSDEQPATPEPAYTPVDHKLASFFAAFYSAKEALDGGVDEVLLRTREWATEHPSFDSSFHAATRYKGRIGRTNHQSGTNHQSATIQPRTNGAWLEGLEKIHRRDLPMEPRSYDNLSRHPLGDRFKQAQKDHLQGHEKMGTWMEVDRPDRGQQVLDCMWVYVYKLDKHGYLLKCKARLVIRGDQEAKDGEDNYAATLAGRSFRTLMAMVTKFDLETAQYDAVNAFVHTDIDGDVYMRMPRGYEKPNRVYKLRKALFGLRRSPILWQKDLTKELRGLGFRPVPHEPCAMTKNGVLIFFYVDDLVFCFEEEHRKEMEEIVRCLKRRFHLEGGGELQWFLGIEVIRNRKAKRMWLSQASYIEQLAGLLKTANKTRIGIPMKLEELLPRTGTATTGQRRLYQRKIGSVMYLAVMTRPDIAFAVSRLSRFNGNPGLQHEEATEWLIKYLLSTKNYALEYKDGLGFQISSDAAFADNSLDRKSSQAFVMKLFGGTICWKATKQTTVTTSSTEAELLSLSYTAKEALFMNRLLKDLKLRLPEAPTIECDNKQTIRLVTQEISALQTRLRHVDIHNHWLRQETMDGRVKIEWKPTNKMLADGLTKALSGAKFRTFLEMMGLVDISSELLEKRDIYDLNRMDFEWEMPEKGVVKDGTKG